MRYAKRDKETKNLPTIWLTEGRHFLDVGRDMWRQNWDEVYRFEVDRWQMVKGVRISLDSLRAAVFPDLKENPKARAATERRLAKEKKWGRNTMSFLDRFRR